MAAAAGSSDSVAGAAAADREEIEAEIEQRYEAKLKAALEEAARKANSDGGGVPVEQVEKVTSQYKTLVAELKKKLEKTLQDLQRKVHTNTSSVQSIQKRPRSPQYIGYVKRL